MRYSIAYGNPSIVTPEGGELDTVEIRFHGRQLKVNTKDLVKVVLHSGTDKLGHYVKVVFKHLSGCKGVRCIRCRNNQDLQDIKTIFVQEYVLSKGIDEQDWSVQKALFPDTTEVVFEDLG